MNFRDAFDVEYLARQDLDNRPRNVVIRSVMLEPVGRGKHRRECLVARFFDPNIRPLVLSLKNCERLAEITNSEDITMWSELEIELCPDFMPQAAGFPGVKIRWAPPPENVSEDSETPEVEDAPVTEDQIDEALPTITDTHDQRVSA